uniref:Movement protein n=1 Tax=Gongylonema pulchrum TaxID=637853 RepID=A0A183DDT7_9BILA
LDTSLVLSTARPSLAGTMPTLGTLNAEFYKPPPRRIYHPHRPSQRSLFGSIQPMRQVQ